MRQFTSTAATFALAIALSGCAPGSGGGSGGAEMYRETLGQASPHDFSRHTRRILGRFNFLLERVDSTASLHGATGASNLRVIELTAENQVLIGETNEWLRDMQTDLFREYVKEIANALKTEFRGMRVY